MTKFNESDYPVIYYKLSSVLNKVTYAVIMYSPKSVMVYDLMNPDGKGQIPTFTREMLSDTEQTLRYMPISTRNVLRESVKVLTSASDKEIEDFIEEIRNITEDEVDQAYKEDNKR